MSSTKLMIFLVIGLLSSSVFAQNDSVCSVAFPYGCLVVTGSKSMYNQCCGVNGKKVDKKTWDVLTGNIPSTNRTSFQEEVYTARQEAMKKGFVPEELNKSELGNTVIPPKLADSLNQMAKKFPKKIIINNLGKKSVNKLPVMLGYKKVICNMSTDGITVICNDDKYIKVDTVGSEKVGPLNPLGGNQEIGDMERIGEKVIPGYNPSIYTDDNEWYNKSNLGDQPNNPATSIGE